MSDPQRWQLNQQPYTQPYAPRQPLPSAYAPNNMYNSSSTPEPQQPLPPLRPLQPSPYINAGYPIYPYPKNNNQPIEESEADKAEARRTRISRACDACRRKKIKCDTSGPGNTCKNCKSSKLECTFNDSAKKRGPPKGYIEVLENRLKRMEKILGNFAGDQDTTDQAESSAPSPKKKKFDKSREKCQHVTANNMSQIYINQVTPNTTTSATAEKTTGAKTESQAIEPVEFASLTTGMRTRYIGDMSPLPFLAQKINFEDARIASKIGIKIRRFGQSLILYERDERLNGKTANQVLLEELNILKPGETIKSLNDWIYKVAGLDKTTSDSLMKIYFAYIHPGLPVVNKVLFLKQYRGEIGEYPSAPLLNAMFGAAVRYMETCDINGDKVYNDHQINLKEGWSENLFDNLINFVKGRYAPCISTVQALLIGQNHRASLDDKMASAWLLNSAACRMAQDLGLHRSSESWDIPESEKETRKRVFWSVFIFDKWSSASTGRPQAIFDEDCDEKYPNESADWDEVMDVGKDDDVGPRFPSLDKSVAQKAKSENIPIYQPFVQLIKLSEILGKILQGLYTPLAKKHSEKHGSDAIVTYLDNVLSEWRSSLPPALQISSINLRRLDSHGKIPLLSMSGLMYLSYCTLLILLHRPFIEKEGGQKTRSSQSSLSICTSAATRCVDIAEKMHYRDFLLVSWNFAIYPVFTASIIHIYNAANPDSIVSDVAKSNLIKAVGVIKRLSKLSPAAGHLFEVLRQLMRLRDIQVDSEEMSDADIDEETKKSLLKCIKSVKSPHKCSSSKGKRRQLSGGLYSEDPSSINDMEISPGKVSDVGRGSGIGGSRMQIHTRNSSVEMHSPSNNVHSDSEIASAHSTPTSMGNGDWINGLYSSLQSENMNQGANTVSNQQQQQQQQQPKIIAQQQQSQQPLSQNSLEDPYSLRQFGINMEPMYNPQLVNQPYLPQQQQSYNNNNINESSKTSSNNSSNSMTPLLQQQQSLSAVMLPINPADSFLFGLSDVGFSSTFNMQPSVNTYVTMPSAGNYSMPQQQPMDQTVFRNRPDNPFWSMPSSIELDDWTAYLLPQQPNATSTNTSNTPVITNSTASSTQQQPGWSSSSSGWV